MKNCLIVGLFTLVLPSLSARSYIANIAPTGAYDLAEAGAREALTRQLKIGPYEPVVVQFAAAYNPTVFHFSLGNLFHPRPARSIVLRGIFFPAASPRAFLLGVHGLQSNSRWYYQTGRGLAASGISTLFFDRRGSGISDSVLDDDGRPRPGHVAGTAADQLLAGPFDGFLIGDPAEFLADIRAAYTELLELRVAQGSQAPIHLYANCFGARVGFAFAGDTRNPAAQFSSIITTSPGTNMRKGEIKGALDRFKIAGPLEYDRKIELVDTDFTNNPAALAQMGNDRLSLALRTVSNRFLMEANGLTQKMNAAIKSSTFASVPALVILPLHDKIINAPATEATFRDKYRGPTMVAWINSEHMVEFNDRAQPDLVRLMAGWILGGSADPEGYDAFLRHSKPHSHNFLSTWLPERSVVFTRN